MSGLEKNPSKPSGSRPGANFLIEFINIILALTIKAQCLPVFQVFPNPFHAFGHIILICVQPSVQIEIGAFRRGQFPFQSFQQFTALFSPSHFQGRIDKKIGGECEKWGWIGYWRILDGIWDGLKGCEMDGRDWKFE
jgi:hypothetical protein